MQLVILLILIFRVVKKGHSQNLSSVKSASSSRSFVLPINITDEALIIKTGVRVEDVNSVRTLNMDFFVDFFLQQSWDLPEATCNEYTEILKYHNLSLIGSSASTIIIPSSHIDKFWIPDTFLVNAKEVTAATDTAKTLKFFKPSENCHLEYTQKLLAVFGCQMNFRQYPYDVQICITKFRSFSYPLGIIKYQWKQNKSVTQNPELRLLQQTLKLVKGTQDKSILNANYSLVTLEFHFTRELSHSIVNIYVPSMMIVVLSWLSFWMGLGAVPGRVAVCVTSLLTLVTQFSSAKQNLPPVSYLCAVDVWMISCMLFVFASMLEFTFVFHLEQTHKKQKKEQETSELPRRIYSNCVRKEKLLLETHSQMLNQRLSFRFLPYPVENYANDIPSVQYEKANIKIRKETNRKLMWLDVDKFSRIIFPTLFVIFNIIYWPLVLTRIF